MHISFYKQLQI